MWVVLVLEGEACVLREHVHHLEGCGMGLEGCGIGVA